MSNRVYPRTVWVLQPSFKPVSVVVTGPYSTYTYTDYGDTSDKGKRYPVEDMHATKEDAIRAGRDACFKVQADIDKRTENLRKRIAALDKAEGK